MYVQINWNILFNHSGFFISFIKTKNVFFLTSFKNPVKEAGLNRILGAHRVRQLWSRFLSFKWP
jgi:hypothetical protein